MKIIQDETFEVDNIICINKSQNNFIIHKCIYISETKFELQLMNTIHNIQEQRLYEFEYFQDSGSILIKNGSISISVSNINSIKQNLRVFFKNHRHYKFYKIEFNITDTLNITIKFLDKNEIIKEPIYIKYYNNTNNKYKIEIKNINSQIYTQEITSPFKITKIPNNFPVTKYKIPRTIVQTYNTRKVNRNTYNATRTWTLLNPTFQYKFFDDSECRAFLKEYFHKTVLKAFNSLQAGAFKADLFRYCYLYEKGGVYSDIDNLCLVPLNDIISKNDSFVTVKDRPVATIFNAFMACHPRNPVLKDTINQIVYNVTHRIYFDSGNSLIDALSYTGPRCLALSLNKYLGRPLINDFKPGNFPTEKIPYKLFLYSKHPYITHNKKQIIKMKYDGYSTTTNYWKLCTEKKVYK